MQSPAVADQVCAQRYFMVGQHKVEVKHAVPRAVMMAQHDKAQLMQQPLMSQFAQPVNSFGSSAYLRTASESSSPYLAPLTLQYPHHFSSDSAAYMPPRSQYQAQAQRARGMSEPPHFMLGHAQQMPFQAPLFVPSADVLSHVSMQFPATPRVSLRPDPVDNCEWLESAPHPFAMQAPPSFPPPSSPPNPPAKQ